MKFLAVSFVFSLITLVSSASLVADSQLSNVTFRARAGIPSDLKLAPFVLPRGTRLRYDTDRWQHLEVALPHPSTPVTFILALHQRNLDQLAATALDVSNPKSASYGGYLSKDQVLDLVAPPAADAQLVSDWLKDAGVVASDVINHRDAIRFVAPVAVAEKLFDIKFAFFQSKASSRVSMRHVSLSKTSESNTPIKHLPKQFERVPSLISFPESPTLFPKNEEPIPTPENPRVRSASKPSSDITSHAKSDDITVTPNWLRSHYNIPDDLFASHPDNLQVIEAFGDSNSGMFPSCSLRDLASFRGAVDDSFGYSDVSYTGDGSASGCFPVGTCMLEAELNGAANGKMESCLDLEYITAIARGVKTQWHGSTYWLYTRFQELAMNPGGLVHSVSYGYAESKQCDPARGQHESCSDAMTYIARVNTELNKLTTMGISVVVSSGDSGAPGRQSRSYCQDTIIPDFPASSPWITSVGATMMVGGEEVSCSTDTGAMISSGGGFSLSTPAQTWQKSAVDRYFATVDRLPRSRSDYNTSNRGYPDISLLGHSYQVCSYEPCGSPRACFTNGYAQCSGCGNKRCGSVDGTSASAPAFAGMVTLLNDWRLKHKVPALGFLNPLLYHLFDEAPEVFRDIVSGNNECAEVRDQYGDYSCCRGYGYFAAKGWDPVTGLGVPDFSKLYTYLCTNWTFGPAGAIANPADLPKYNLLNGTGTVQQDPNTHSATVTANVLLSMQSPTGLPKAQFVDVVFSYDSDSKYAGVTYDASIMQYDTSTGALNVSATIDNLKCGCKLYAQVNFCHGPASRVEIAQLSCCEKPDDSKLLLIIGVAAGGAALLVIIIVVICCYRRRKKAQESHRAPLLNEPGPPELPYGNNNARPASVNYSILE